MAERTQLIYQVQLPGGQERLRAIILYVAKRCEGAPRFGKIKLNKIIWKADFDAYAERGTPVTGRAYQRLEWGPAPVEMAPILGELVEQGLLAIEETDFGDGVVEQRPRALDIPSLQDFTPTDLSYVDEAIDYYWDKTGRETSDDSHGIAWKTRANLDPMPYNLALLSDRVLNPVQEQRLLKLAVEKGWRSQ